MPRDEAVAVGEQGAGEPDALDRSRDMLDLGPGVRPGVAFVGFQCGKHAKRADDPRIIWVFSGFPPACSANRAMFFATLPLLPGGGQIDRALTFVALVMVTPCEFRGAAQKSERPVADRIGVEI